MKNRVLRDYAAKTDGQLGVGEIETQRRSKKLFRLFFYFPKQSNFFKKSYCTRNRSCYYPRPLFVERRAAIVKPKTDNRSLYGTTYSHPPQGL